MEEFEVIYPENEEERKYFVNAVKDLFEKIVGQLYSSEDVNSSLSSYKAEGLNSKDAFGRLALDYLDESELSKIRNDYKDEPAALSIIDEVIQQKTNPSLKLVSDIDEDEDEDDDFAGERF